MDKSLLVENEAYLEIVEQDGEVKLLCSNGEKEGKKIVVDLFKEGSIDLKIPEEVTCVDVRFRFPPKFPCKIKSVFVSKNVKKIVSLGDLLETVETIEVDEGNQIYDSRNDCNAIIESSTDKLIAGCETTEIPNRVKEIGERAFRGTGITNINLPDGLQKIGNKAFSGCKNLVEIKLPDSVTSIGQECFCESSLKSIVIPDTVTEIGSAAFWECRALEKITIPAVKFGSHAFCGCKNISEVYFSDSVKCLDMKQFVDGSGLYYENRDPFSHLKKLRFSASIEKIDNLDNYFKDIDTLVFEGHIPETNGSFKVCTIKELIINQSRKHAGEIPADIHDALRKVNGNYIYGTPDSCKEESTIPGYIKATLAKNEELIDINTKYIISVEPCEYLHYKNVGSMIKCAADAGNHVAYEIKVHEPCDMIYGKISKSLKQLGSNVGGIGGLINLIETLYKNRKE